MLRVADGLVVGLPSIGHQPSRKVAQQLLRFLSTPRISQCIPGRAAASEHPKLPVLCTASIVRTGTDSDGVGGLIAQNRRGEEDEPRGERPEIGYDIEPKTPITLAELGAVSLTDR